MPTSLCAGLQNTSLLSARSLLITSSFIMALVTSNWAAAQAIPKYQFSFPDAVHHVMHVDATFENVPSGPFRLQAARASAGRYSACEFAENIFHVEFANSDGSVPQVVRPDPRSWLLLVHTNVVRLSYDVFGDRVDGTWLGVSESEAHINMPAVLIWANASEAESVRVRLEPPPGTDWQIATQLYSTSDPHTFTAPNFQYLMDSPVVLGRFSFRSFTVPPIAAGDITRTVRVAVHFTGSEQELNGYVEGLQKIVKEEQAVFGQLPDFEPGYYTFLLDYGFNNSGDGMEHRNSAVVTSGRALSRERLSTPAHEFFHSWNVKRIRPASLEPFNYRDVSSSDELWFAEGFTNYYERLIMLRTGLTSLQDGLTEMTGEIGYVTESPGSRFRSAVAMSEMAAFVDRTSTPVPTDMGNTFVSYYSFGDVIAIALDLSLRSREGSQVSLDDFMRAMWIRFGKPGGPPGVVTHPYTLAGFESTLEKVSGSTDFSLSFMRHYVLGTDVIDLAPLFLRAGIILQVDHRGATLGSLNLESVQGGLRIAQPTPVGSPAYVAGLSMDDELLSVEDVSLNTSEDLAKIIKEHHAGDMVDILLRRQGVQRHVQARLATNTVLTLTPLESTGGVLTNAQRSFRESWLGSKTRRCPSPGRRQAYFR